jgi:hypothetical protein
MVQRVRTAARLPAWELAEDAVLRLALLYATKCCSSRSDHQLCLLMLLLDGSSFSDTGASTSMKQLAPPPVQERPAPVRGRFLNFVEQRTRIVPSLRLGRVAKMYSHERSSFHIRSSIISSSSVHRTLLLFSFNSA